MSVIASVRCPCISFSTGQLAVPSMPSAPSFVSVSVHWLLPLAYW
jgi:hypothetical protein